MARRPGGKAASRRSRQRRVQRTTLPPSTAAAPPPVEDREVEERSEPREDARKASAPTISAPSAARAYAGPGGSSLTDRERAEYHYVERDLRNIGILTAIMFALLAAAWFVFNALGIIG